MCDGYYITIVLILFQTQSAKELLAEKLGIPPYLDQDDPQKAPFIDYIYDNLTFAVGIGLPWNHIRLIVEFAHVFLKGILGKCLYFMI